MRFLEKHKKFMIITIVMCALCILSGGVRFLSSAGVTQAADNSSDEAYVKLYEGLRKPLTLELPGNKADMISTVEETMDSTWDIPEDMVIDETTFYIRINRALNCVTIYIKDDNGEYTVPVKSMVCSTGDATPLGTYGITDKYEWRMLEGNVWGQYACRITGSILFHSVPYYTNAKDDLEADEYNKLGTKASLGCIRLSVIDAKWIFDNCPSGTAVELYDDESDPGPLGKPTPITIPSNATWDPTDPDKSNPWLQDTASINGLSTITVNIGSSIDYMDYVKAYDTQSVNISDKITVKGTVNTSKPGEYVVTYSLVDGTTTVTHKITFVVKDTSAPTITGIYGEIVTSNPSSITKEYLLANVSVSDNCDTLTKSDIEIYIPSLVEGKNTVVYTIVDSSGNTKKAYTTVFVDTTAPQLGIISGMTSTVASTIDINEAYALSRLSISDASEIASAKASISTTDNVNYTITYTVSDICGNTSTYTESIVKEQVKETEPVTQPETEAQTQKETESQTQPVSQEQTTAEQTTESTTGESVQ